MLNLTLVQKHLSVFRNVHHKGSKNFCLQSCVSTSKEKPNTTKESFELTVVWSLAARPCWQ